MRIKIVSLEQAFTEKDAEDIINKALTTLDGKFINDVRIRDDSKIAVIIYSEKRGGARQE